MRRWLRDNGLSLFFGAIFLLALRRAVGRRAGRLQQPAAGRTAPSPVSYGRYVTSSDFAVDVAENWQSEYLQFFLYIFATVWLVQRGSPESKQLDEVGPESDEEQQVGRYASDDSPRWARAGGLAAPRSTPARSAW